MPPSAKTRHGEPVSAGQFSGDEWEALKLSGQLGDFVMPCCPSSAVLKTSPNGVQFSAHPSGECAAAPETVWHQTGKALVLASARALGLTCRDEACGGFGQRRWRADTAIYVDGRTVVVELQRSYQHFRDYRKRQARYKEAGVESYWLVRDKCLPALLDSITRFRIKEEFGGKAPSKNFFPALPDLPWAVLDIDDPAQVRGPLLKMAAAEWLKALVDQRYQYIPARGCWTIA
jgi:competence protein CoiA